MAGLWIAYLVPHRLRYRQQLLEARADDRYSAGLRVLRVAAAAEGRRVAPPSDAGRQQDRPALHRTGSARGGGRVMDRPHAARDRISADAARRSAAEHAARAAHLARRAAAARRRALLTLVLGAATLVGWGVVVATGAALAVALVPTAGLLGVLGLGRRAVVQAARADAEWEAGAATRLPVGTSARAAAHVPGVVGRAVHPSDATTEVMARVPRAPVRGREGVPVGHRTATPEPAAGTSAESTSGAVTGRTSASGTAPVRGTAEQTPEQTREQHARSAVEVAPETTWAPVPVPRPTYTLKPSAPRREPAPLVVDAPAPAPAASVAETVAEASADAAAPTASAPGTGSAPGLSGGRGLDAVLARRRAAGE